MKSLATSLARSRWYRASITKRVSRLSQLRPAERAPLRGQPKTNGAPLGGCPVHEAGLDSEGGTARRGATPLLDHGQTSLAVVQSSGNCPGMVWLHFFPVAHVNSPGGTTVQVVSLAPLLGSEFAE